MHITPHMIHVYTAHSFALFFIYWLSISPVQSQSLGKYSNEFLQIGVGAQALGMGNAVVANTQDVTAAYWNPAGLATTNRWLDLGLMHSEYFAGIAKYDYLGLAHSVDEQSALALSCIRFAVDDIPNTTQLIDNNGNINYDRITTFSAADYAFLLSYARKTTITGLSAGGNVKIIYRQIGDFAKSWGFGLDAGVQYHKGKHWKFGATLRDVTSTFNAWIFTLDETTKKVFEKTNNQIPKNGLELTLPRLIIGTFAKYPIRQFSIACEINAEITSDGQRNTLLQSKTFSIDPKIGLALGFKHFVSLRMGITNVQYIKDFNDSKRLNVQPNIGLGLHLKNFYLDYAYTDIGDASVALYSHVISLRIVLQQAIHIQQR